MKTAKKTAKRLTAILLALMTIVSCLSLMASAKNVCKEVSGRAADEGRNAKVFYVTAKDTKGHSLKMKMTKGKLEACDMMRCSFFDKSTYGFYEIKVYGKKNGSYVQLSKCNVKGASSYTISLPIGYKEYKVRVYNWDTETIVKNQRWFTSIWYAACVYYHWSSTPTWKISSTSGLSYCVD